MTCYGMAVPPSRFRAMKRMLRGKPDTNFWAYTTPTHPVVAKSVPRIHPFPRGQSREKWVEKGERDLQPARARDSEGLMVLRKITNPPVEMRDF